MVDFFDNRRGADLWYEETYHDNSEERRTAFFAGLTPVPAGMVPGVAIATPDEGRFATPNAWGLVAYATADQYGRPGPRLFVPGGTNVVVVRGRRGTSIGVKIDADGFLKLE